MANWFNKLKNRTRPNPKRFIGVVAVVFAAILSLGEASSWAQFGGSNNYGGGFYGGAGGGMENPDDPGVRAKMEASQRLANAMSEFHRAQGDDAKAAAQKKLLEALTKYFDADMKVREAGLQKVEAQVKTLRSQFDKRVSKKQEILDLQMKLLENETEGLGFFNIAQPNGMPLMPAPALAPQFTDPGTDWVTSWVAPAVGPAPAPTSGGNAGGMMAPTRAASPQPRPKDAPTPGAATLRGGPENPLAPAPRPREEGGNQE